MNSIKETQKAIQVYTVEMINNTDGTPVPTLVLVGQPGNAKTSLITSLSANRANDINMIFNTISSNCSNIMSLSAKVLSEQLDEFNLKNINSAVQRTSVVACDVSKKDIGDTVGIPYVVDGAVVYNKMPEFQNVYLQHVDYANKLASKYGMLNGRLHINDEHELLLDDNVIYKYHGLSKDNDTINCTIFNAIPSEIRFALIENGDVAIKYILVDELDKAQQTVYNEIMNVLQQRKLVDYDIPWFAVFIGAQNPDQQMCDDDAEVSATSSATPALRDRLIYWPIEPTDEETYNYLISIAQDQDELDSILIAADINKDDIRTRNAKGISKLDSLVSETMSNRTYTYGVMLMSRTMKLCYKHRKIMSSSEFVNAKSKDDFYETCASILRAKWGTGRADDYCTRYQNKDKLVLIDDICNDKPLKPEVIAKFKANAELIKSNICFSVLKYLNDQKFDQVFKSIKQSALWDYSKDLTNPTFNENAIPMPMRQYIINFAEILKLVKPSTQAKVGSDAMITKRFPIYCTLIAAGYIASEYKSELADAFN